MVLTASGGPVRTRWRHRRRADAPTAHEAVASLTECPPPWEAVAPARDARYREIVAEHGPELVRRVQARPEARTWLLVRYLPDVPTELVERALATFKREAIDFCELAGGTPDMAAAETWEAQWRGAARASARRRRAAS